MEGGRRHRILTVAIALAVPATIALSMWGVTVANGQGAGCTQTVDVGIVHAKGCWTQSGNVYTSTQPVDLNGFTITPSATAPLTIDTDQRLVTTKGAQVGVAANPVTYEPMPLEFHPPNSGSMQIGQVELPPVTTLAGFTLVGNAMTQITINDTGGSVDLPLQFFNFLTVIGKNQAVTAHSVVEPGKGLEFDGLDIDVNGLQLKAVPIGIEEFHADYSLSEQRWGGSANVTFSKGEEEAGFKFGLHVTQGKLTDFSTQLSGLAAPLTPAIMLQKLNGGMGFDPFSANFGAGVTAGPEMKILGREVSAVAVDGQMSVKATSGNVPGYLGLGGQVYLISLPVANASLKAYFSGALDFNANVGIGLPELSSNPNQPFFIGAQVSGWMGPTGFNFSGNAQLKLFAQQIAGAGLVFSNKGLGACAEISVVFAKVSVGFGYSFATQTATPYFAGCDLGPYQNWNKPATRLARTVDGSAQGSLNSKHKVLRIVGEDDVPGFTLTSEDGDTTIEHDAEDVDGQTVEDSHMVIPNETAGEAIVLLNDPEGDWTIEEAPGSEIANIQRASELPKERVEAEVRGHGRERTLVWDARDLPRQRLQFHERLGNGVIEPIHNTGKAHGRHRFTPHQGGFYGNRKLEVQVLQEGNPRAEKVVDNYRVAKPTLPRRPRELDVEVNRRGHDVRAEWSRSRGARGYAVVLEDGEGELRFTKVVGKNRLRAAFEDTPLAHHMAVKVFALNRDDQHGRPAKRTFDAPGV